MDKSRFCILNLVIVILAIATNLQSVISDQDTHDHHESSDAVAASQTDEQTPLQDPEPTAENATYFNGTQPRRGQGANTVEHGEYCDFGSRPCNSLKDLYCIDGLCKCKSNEREKFVFGETSERCVPITEESRGWSCTDNSQCTSTSYGMYSRCNLTTGFGHGVCQCYDTLGERREVVEFERVCYIKKKIGGVCQTNLECNATIKGEAHCLGIEISGKGVCSCADRHEFYQEFDECLKHGLLNSVCKTNLQCQHASALGELSRCRNDTKTCACYDTKGHDEKRTGFFEGRCYYSRKLNQTCDAKVECHLGYHRDAVCQEHPSYNNEKICQCPEGKTCKGVASSTLATTSIVFLMISFVIFFKK